MGELDDKLDLTMKSLESLEGLMDSSPEHTELAPYLRIAIASLRTAVRLYGNPLNA